MMAKMASLAEERNGWKETDEVTITCKTLWNAQTESFIDGRKLERTEIVRMMKDRICYDHIEKHKCDHSACYALEDLIREITEKEDK